MPPVKKFAVRNASFVRECELCYYLLLSLEVGRRGRFDAPSLRFHPVVERRDEPEQGDDEHRCSGREDEEDGRRSEVDDLEDGESEPPGGKRDDGPAAELVGDGREQPLPEEDRVGEPGPDADGEREPALAGREPAQIAGREPGEQRQSDEQDEELAHPSRRGDPVAVLVAAPVERGPRHHSSVRRRPG